EPRGERPPPRAGEARARDRHEGARARRVEDGRGERDARETPRRPRGRARREGGRGEGLGVDREAVILPSILLALITLQRTAPSPGDAEVRAAEQKALAYLLAHQETDGSFGNARNGSFNDLWSNPETHKSWTVGTTGLAVMALLGEGPRVEPALRRAVGALV